MKQSKFYRFLSLILVISIFACNKQSSPNDFIELETVNLWVNKVKVPCSPEVTTTCYLVQDGETLGEEWSVLNDAIIGFDDQYEVGFIYQIEIHVEEVPNETGDAITIKYNLVRVISKEE